MASTPVLRMKSSTAPRADGRAVHAAKEVQRLVPLFFLVKLGEQAVAGQVADRSDRNAFHGQSARQSASEVDAGQHVFLVGVEFLDYPAQPAFHAKDFRLTGGPDVHGAEVRQAAVGVADALDDGQLTLVPVLLQGSHRGVKAQGVGQGNDHLFGDAQGRAVVPVARVAVGNDRVHPVVPAGQGDYSQDRILAGGYHRYSSVNLVSDLCLISSGAGVRSFDSFTPLPFSSAA